VYINNACLQCLQPHDHHFLYLHATCQHGCMHAMRTTTAIGQAVQYSIAHNHKYLTALWTQPLFFRSTYMARVPSPRPAKTLALARTCGALYRVERQKKKQAGTVCTCESERGCEWHSCTYCIMLIGLRASRTCTQMFYRRAAACHSVLLVSAYWNDWAQITSPSNDCSRYSYFGGMLVNFGANDTTTHIAQ
jgi:hypothetical protein